MQARKWTYIYLSALAVVAMLFAFGAAGFSSQSVEARQGGKVLLGSWDDENGNKRHRDALDDFNAEFPDIDVEILPHAGGDWHTKVLTWIAAGELPDLYMADSSFLPLYAEAGGLENLRPYIEGENGFDPYEIFYPGVYENGFYQGDPYLLNKDYSTVAVYANKALFDAAGIDLPEVGWTYDDLLDIAMQLTIDENGNNAASPDFDPDAIVQYGMDHRGNWWRSFQSVVYSFGSHTISEDGLTFDGYINSPETVAALEWMRDAIHVYHVAPTNEYMTSLPSGSMQPFLDGQHAMVFGMGPWFLGMLEEQPGFEWAILPIPEGPGGHHSAVCWAGFGMSPTSENKDDAWLVLKALSTDIGQRHYSEHALSAMPVMMEEKIDHPFWGVFIEEATYLDSLDDLKNQYYLLCLGDPTTFLETAFGEAGADLDMQAFMDEQAAIAQECLDSRMAE